jgi:hypothetical protein
MPPLTTGLGTQIVKLVQGTSPSPTDGWLLRTQKVSFSASLIECSAAKSCSQKLTLSITEIAPLIVKVLFFALAAMAAWLD